MAQINQMLNADRINTPLVVHGGTGLPDDYVKDFWKPAEQSSMSPLNKHALIDATYDYISTKRDE